MLIARIHLDDCAEENGALRVIKSSHDFGIMSRDQIKSIVLSESATVLTAKAGDVLLMKPLLLHASSPARNPSHRRVLHLEFAPEALLPDGLGWAEAA
jgi:ectoine hydroxylase-related dioxygenase (phytanoyl-CoA dioxygenase family)